MALAYPDHTLSDIEALVTISSLSALITILLNERIIKRLGLKSTIISGLLLGMFSGIFPFFTSNYFIFVLSRFILGLGIGLFSPHALSLISLFYKGDERTVLLGMQLGITALGNAILLTLSGWLAAINWQFTFIVYLFLGFIAVLIWKYVPNVKIKYSSKKTMKHSISKPIKKLLILNFFTFLIIWGVQLKIPSYLMENGITSSKNAGIVLGSMNIAGMFSGLVFGFSYKKLKDFLLPLGFIGAAISVLGIVTSQSWGDILFFSVVFNFVYSFTGPYLTLKINLRTTESQLTMVNSMIITTTILSSFAAPFFWNSVTSLVDKNVTAQVSMIMMMISLLVIGGYLISFYVSKPKKFSEGCE